MSKLVAIIAPVKTEKQHEADFRIILKNYEQELNLKFLYEFISHNYNVKKNPGQYMYKEDTVAAAGYFLSSTLRKAGYDTILTQFFDDNTLQDIANKNPIAICLSTTMILKKESCLKVIKQIRKFMADIKIIIGGILCLKSFLIKGKRNENEAINTDGKNETDWALFTQFEKDYRDCLFITSHHGIHSLFRILKEIEKGKKAQYLEIPNMVIPLKNKFHFTRYEEDIINLNEEFTRWDLIDKLPQRIPIQTSIGCPYRCLYCDFCTLYPKLLIKNRVAIHKELVMIKKVVESRHRSAILNFTDDNIFINQKRLEDICNTIIDSDVQLPWTSFMRASSVSISNIDLLKKSNQLAALVGVESGDIRILRAMNKEQKPEEVKTVIELLDRNRIFTLMTFLVGFPGENNETLNNTAAFINSLNLSNLFVMYQLYPFKVGILSAISNTENRKKWELAGTFDKWKHLTMDSKEAGKAVYRLFKKIDKISAFYIEESTFFLYRFNYKQRKTLFDLRKKLTIAIYEDAREETIQTIFHDIALAMDLPAILPGHDIIKQLYVPGY